MCEAFILSRRVERSVCCMFIHHVLTGVRGEGRLDKPLGYIVKKDGPYTFYFSGVWTVL